MFFLAQDRARRPERGLAPLVTLSYNDAVYRYQNIDIILFILFFYDIFLRGNKHGGRPDRVFQRIERLH